MLPQPIQSSTIRGDQFSAKWFSSNALTGQNGLHTNALKSGPVSFGVF